MFASILRGEIANFSLTAGYDNSFNVKKRRAKYLHESILILSVLFVIIASGQAQYAQPNVSPPNQEVQIIEMLSGGDEGFSGTRIGLPADVLILVDRGNDIPIIFYHNGAYLFADSAHFSRAYNTFEAFGNVHMNQGDTLFMYAAYLHYDGNTALLRLRDNVRLEDATATLFTDSLNFDRIANLGYFFEGGMLVDEENVLTAYWGQYSPDTNIALFRDNVRLVNENFTIYADTLIHNTATLYATIVGPSRIVSEDGVIYTSRGWYHTESERTMLLDRSRMYSNDHTQVLTGDTIFYNRATGIGEAFGNMELLDVERSLILRGNYGFFNEFTEFGFATDMAYAIDFSQADSLFIGGDSLFMITITEDYRDFRAYANVRIWRQDFQAIADSIHYSAQDSTIFMRGRPVLWSENQQITGHEIDILMNDSTVERVYIRGSAFAVEDRGVDDQFNQLSGRNMTAYFRDGEIVRIFIEGDAESIYYLTEDDGFVIGLNRTLSSEMAIDIEDQLIERIWLGGAGRQDATTTPLPQLAPGANRLTGFVWLYYLRPLHSGDIFRKNIRHTEDDLVVPQRSFVREVDIW